MFFCKSFLQEFEGVIQMGISEILTVFRLSFVSIKLIRKSKWLIEIALECVATERSQKFLLYSITGNFVSYSVFGNIHQLGNALQFCISKYRTGWLKLPTIM